ncbi:cyclic peptide export ABC transporter [Bacillus thuringiensis]|uniref:Peptide ABC transporter n=1 Tax=Bacillus thuringiensis TaxID=1428 RepID=A0A9X7BKK3_BACTU|nr:cyclic peptide export ABC transporter [Bacillus thuringiensis]MED4445708.1 cyclic peptide export ABC transporter [Bacillus cereus]PEB44116.1 peptide ABC transporter [Bacillus thuringiensis]PED24996.1 peptide ABC transporter [Bacillus thuringiensis]PFL11129.1 peptide ABC transporter [Bacillus thuringiensis]PFV27997.1 peptide ABC transporter [Bacillus thuringiensis]
MKKAYKLLLVLIFFLSTLLVPLGSYALSNSTDEINHLSNNEKIKIEGFIDKQMNKGKIPGLSIVIVQGDKTVYQKGFGYSDLESEKRVTSNSLFEIGSNSKAFTALGILNLQKSGLIKIDDKVNKYIPWLKVKYKGKEASITIEELIYHTSGIPFKTIDKIPVSSDDNAIEETIKTLVNIELDSKPGEKFQYATINYDVLGLVIEKVTGVSYEKYIEENVLKPMGLNNTYLYSNKTNIEDLAKGYKIGFFKPRLYDAPVYRGNKPAGYIISSAEDMAKWLKIQMGSYEDSKINVNLIHDSHKLNRRIPPLEDGSSYAAGWFIYQKGDGEIAHGGNNPNYSSYIMFRPEDKVGIAVLSNTNSEYVSAITNGVNEILQGREYNQDIKDLNQSVDRISILIICIASLIIISNVYFIYIVLRQIIRKERKLNKIGIKGTLGFIFSFIFMLGLSYCIYSIPYIIFGELSWGFVFVWLPNSVKIATYLVYICIWLMYLHILITSFCKKKDEKSILILSLLSIVSGFGNALIIITINRAISSNNSMKINLLVYFILGIILYVYGQKIIRKKLIKITNEIVYSKRLEIVKCLLRAPYNKYEEIEKGRIESTLNNDTETISGFADILIGGVTSAITLICCFIYLGFINIFALLLSVAVIVLIASVYYFVGRYANKVGEEARDTQNEFFKFINDLTGGFKELTLNKKRKIDFEADMEKSCDTYRVKRSQASFAFANMFVIGELLFTLAIGAVVFLFPFILKNLESTSMASYVFILLYMTGPVHGILNAIPNAIEAKISFKRINDLLNEMSNSSFHNTNEKQLAIEGSINLKLNAVEYEYNENDGKSFKIGPINYEFNSGEIVFIIGGNGSGKSTLAKLITGLYSPSRGYISINNIKISEAMLREKYSTVFSDFYLFNKLYGIDYRGKEEEIERYLQLLQLNTKVEVEDGKLSTTKLSTGQKKRLALLITYLEDRPIYLFDEWAADQDPEYRQFFYDTLLPELKQRGKCVITITHDDQYFDVADKVIKMDMGKMLSNF